MFGPNSDDADVDATASGSRYRAQKRGGKGLRDIKTTDRNGKAVDILPVNDEDEILLMTAKGKIQRIACSTISTIGRNTQGVRIMRLSDGDTLAAVVRVPRDEHTGGPGADGAEVPVEGETTGAEKAADAKPADDQQAAAEKPADETSADTDAADKPDSDSTPADDNAEE